MIKKEFDNWNEEKKVVHGKQETLFYHDREVWWCSLGVNVGSEQDGTGAEHRRPVLIYKGFGPHLCLIIPLTASLQKHKLRLSLGLVGKKEAHALLSQMRVIDTKRLVRKIERLDEKRFVVVQKAVKELL